MAVPDDVALEIELQLRKQCEDDLYTFAREAWKEIEGAKKFQEGWTPRIICEHLEEIYYGRIRRLLINLPFRCSKSTLVSKIFPVWCWIKDSSKQILSISYAEKLSTRDSNHARRLMKSEWFQKRWGNKFQISQDQDTKNRVDNMQGGYRVSAGLDGTITGEGGDIILLDDPNNVRDRSDTLLDSAIDFFTDVLPTRYNDFSTGGLVVCQQRTHERDISGHILSSQRGDFVHLMLPMEFEPKRRSITVPLKSTGGEKWRDPREEENEIMWPERFAPNDLKMLKRELKSEYAIAGQLQQRPAPSEGGMVKRAWWQPWKDDKPPRCSLIIQSWDTAMSAKKEAAYSACTTWGVFKNDIDVPCMILLGAWRGKVEFPELYDQVQRMARDYTATTKAATIRKTNKPDVVLVESKASGHQILQTLNKTGLVLTPWNPDKYGDKVERVRKITHIIEGGRMYVPMRAPDFSKPVSYADLVISQFAVFPKGESRDIVDTASSAIQRVINSGWVLHPMEAEADREESQRREREFVEQQAFY